MSSIWNVGVGRWHLAAAEDISLGLSCWHLPGTYLTSKVGQLLGGMPPTIGGHSMSNPDISVQIAKLEVRLEKKPGDEGIPHMYADDYGNGVVGAYNRKGKQLKPEP